MLFLYKLKEKKLALVDGFGLILANIMYKGNRSLVDVIFDAADKVIIVPGYGLAIAQAGFFISRITSF